MTQFKSTGKGKDRKVFPVGIRRNTAYGRNRDISTDIQALRNNRHMNTEIDNYSIPKIDRKDIQTMQEISEEFYDGSTATTYYGDATYDTKPYIGVSNDDAFVEIDPPLFHNDVTAWKKLKEMPSEEAIKKFNGDRKRPYFHKSEISEEGYYFHSNTFTWDMDDIIAKGITQMINNVANETMRNKKKHVTPKDLNVLFYKHGIEEPLYIAIVPETQSPQEKHNNTYNSSFILRVPIRSNGNGIIENSCNADSFIRALKIYGKLDDHNNKGEYRKHNVMTMGVRNGITITDFSMYGRSVDDTTSGVRIESLPGFIPSESVKTLIKKDYGNEKSNSEILNEL